MENNIIKSTEEVSMKLLKCYSENKCVNISFSENGNTNNICGLIKKIDFVERKIITIPFKKISIFNILKINEVS